MIRLCSVLVFVLFTFFSAHAQNSQIMQSQRLKEITIALYASIYQNPANLPEHRRKMLDIIAARDWRDNNRLVDSLIYLDQNGKANPEQLNIENLEKWLNEGVITLFRDDQIARHIIELYVETNGAHPLIKARGDDPMVLAPFLVLADRFDSKLDLKLERPELNSLFDLLVNDAVPISSIAYQCRISEAWMDRRTMIRPDEVARNLPKSMLNLREAGMSDEQKLTKAVNYLRKKITPRRDGQGTDFWQTPFETLLLGEGDCEDYSILLQSLAEFLNIESHVMIGYMEITRPDGKVDIDYHAWVQLGDKIFDPTRKDFSNVTYHAKIRFNSFISEFTTPELQLSSTRDVYFVKR